MTDQKPIRFQWHASASSGGTLSLHLAIDGVVSKRMKEKGLADAISACQKLMEKRGYIPARAHLLSSRDIANRYGKSRQYWEKLLSEGKILYKETAAGRITTDLWVEGYLGDKERVDKYVKDVRAVLQEINESERRWGTTTCPVCGEERFEYHVNVNGNTNGLCRACSFHVHTSNATGRT